MEERKEIVLNLAILLGLALFLFIAFTLAPSKARAAEDTASYRSQALHENLNSHDQSFCGPDQGPGSDHPAVPVREKNYETGRYGDF